MKKRFLSFLLVLMMAVLWFVPAMADIIRYESGDVYVGDVVNGQPNGIGVYTMSYGSVYRGEFVDGCFHGKGAYFWPEGGGYVGDFVMDAFEGRGILTKPDGEYYIGEFQADTMHGYGTLYAADGTILESGLYEDGTFIGSAAEGTAATLTEEAILGKWSYRFEHSGALAVINFMAGGTCVLTGDGKSAYGAWSIRDGKLLVDDVVITYADGKLYWPVDNDILILTRASAQEENGISEADVLGNWVLYSISMGGEVLISADYAIVSTMTFNEDSTCVMTLNGEVYRDTWFVNGDGMLVMGGDSVNQIINGEIHLDLDGATAVFVRP